MSGLVLWPAQAIVSQYATGNDHGWDEELLFLWTTDRERTLALMDDVLNMGVIEQAVVVGPDRRVWDGHHRIAVGLALSLPVPVVFAEESGGQ